MTLGEILPVPVEPVCRSRADGQRPDAVRRLSGQTYRSGGSGRAALLLVFAGLVVQTYSGRSLVSSVTRLVPGLDRPYLTDADPARVMYTTATRSRSMRWRSASEARMCCFSQVELVLLGATNRLVRLDEGNRLTEVSSSRGHHGPGGEHRRLGRGGCKPGWVTSQMRVEGWRLEVPQLQPRERTLRAVGPPEELTAGRLVPSAAGRIRRRGASTDLAVVVRAERPNTIAGDRRLGPCRRWTRWS